MTNILNFFPVTSIALTLLDCSSLCRKSIGSKTRKCLLSSHVTGQEFVIKSLSCVSSALKLTGLVYISVSLLKQCSVFN